MRGFCARTAITSVSQTALQRWEKAALACAAMLVAVVLATTHWVGKFGGTPEQMRELASRVERELMANSWPAAARQQFGVIPATSVLENVRRTVDSSRFAYSVPPSPRLYVRQAPAEEPRVVPVASLRAMPGRFPLGVYRPAPELDNPNGNLSATNQRPTRDTPVPAEGIFPLPATSTMRPDSMAAAERVDSRGVRFVCVTGVVEVRRQLMHVQRAMRQESPMRAAPFLDYLSFRIQRQRAIPGPDPWAGDWRDLDIQSSLNLLTNEAAQWEPDLVPTEHLNEVFTSPLPQRLDSPWTFEIAGHPAFPAVTWQSAADTTLSSAPSLATGRNSPLSDRIRPKRGFSDLQPQRAKRRNGLDSRSPANPTLNGLADAAHSLRGGSAESGIDAVGTLSADEQLFRYFDFEVEPDECYRYRVQLEIVNPNYGAQRVIEPGVAQGETRVSAWSQPSPPVAIDRDAEYFLTRLARRGRSRGPEILIYQWQPNVGTIARTTLKPKFGQYVGGKGKAELFEIAVPQLSEQELSFATREVLIDAVSAPLSFDARLIHGDLRLTSAEWSDLTAQGKLDRVVVINQFGTFEQIPHAAGNPRVIARQQQLESERKPFRELPMERTSNPPMR